MQPPPTDPGSPRSWGVGILVLAGAVVLGAITGVVVTAGPTRYPSTTATPASSEQAAADAFAPDGHDATDSPPVPEQGAAAVTSTGIPVTVVEASPRGHVVRSPCGDDVEIDTLIPLDPVRVVIDPGHGGPVDTGTLGSNGLLESDLNLAVAQALASQLEDRGISTALTRIGDYAVPIQVRAAFAEAAQAQIMVSIHHNAPRSAVSTEPGTEVYVQSDSPASARLGGILYEESVAALGRFPVAWTSRHDAGVVEVLLDDGRDAYGVIRLPKIPTVLVELGYLDNPAEAAFFATDTYVGAAARALADGVEGYFDTGRTGAGHAQPARTFTPNRSYAPDDCVDPPLGD